MVSSSSTPTSRSSSQNYSRTSVKTKTPDKVPRYLPFRVHSVDDLSKCLDEWIRDASDDLAPPSNKRPRLSDTLSPSLLNQSNASSNASVRSHFAQYKSVMETIQTMLSRSCNYQRTFLEALSPGKTSARKFRVYNHREQCDWKFVCPLGTSTDTCFLQFSAVIEEKQKFFYNCTNNETFTAIPDKLESDRTWTLLWQKPKLLCLQDELINLIIDMDERDPIEVLSDAQFWLDRKADIKKSENLWIECSDTKQSFVYLLLDPRTLEEPKNSSFSDFIASIFYIGKGSGDRPFAHMRSAAGKTQIDLLTDFGASLKKGRINEIWQAKRGVIVLPVHMYCSENEAFMREHCMISARHSYKWQKYDWQRVVLGPLSLTNKDYGAVETLITNGNFGKFSDEERKALGARMLVEAYSVFRNLSVRLEEQFSYNFQACNPAFEQLNQSPKSSRDWLMTKFLLSAPKFEAKLANAALLKKIVTAIKDLVTDAPFDCTENSMSIQAMDGSHVALVSLKLDIALFEVYRCDRTINLGMSMAELNKVLACSKADDTLMICFEANEYDTVTFTFEDTKGRKQDITLKLLDLDNEHLGIPETKYSAVVEMSSSEFQKVCKDIATFSDSMNITAVKNSVVFSGRGDTATNTIRYNNDSTADDEDDKDRIMITVKEKVDLDFSIKYLTHFVKATSLSERVRLSLCDGVPLVVEYDIEGSGYLRFFLAPPKIDEDKEGMDE